MILFFFLSSFVFLFLSYTDWFFSRARNMRNYTHMLNSRVYLCCILSEKVFVFFFHSLTRWLLATAYKIPLFFCLITLILFSVILAGIIFKLVNWPLVHWFVLLYIFKNALLECVCQLQNTTLLLSALFNLWQNIHFYSLTAHCCVFCNFLILW